MRVPESPIYAIRRSPIDQEFSEFYEGELRPRRQLRESTKSSGFLHTQLDYPHSILKSTPLGWACRWGKEDLVQLYLQRGANPLERDAETWAAPLSWAIKRGHYTIAEILRSHIATH